MAELIVSNDHVYNFPLKREDNPDKYDLAIEKFNAFIAHAFQNRSTFEQFMTVHPLFGTNALSSDGLGKVAVGAITPGSSFPKSSPGRDRVTVNVDTVIGTRFEQFILDKRQDDINIPASIPKKQADAMARMADTVWCNKLIEAALTTDGLVNDMPGGTNVELGAAGDELDPNKLHEALQLLVQTMQEKEIDLMDMRIAVPPAQYWALFNHDKIINGDYTTMNGDFAKGTLYKALGLPIIPTVVFPKDADVGVSHPLGVSYDVTQDMADAVALIFTGDALLNARTIDPMSESNYDFDTKSYQIDSMMAMGSAVYQPHNAAVIRKYRA